MANRNHFIIYLTDFRLGSSKQSACLANNLHDIMQAQGVLSNILGVDVEYRDLYAKLPNFFLRFYPLHLSNEILDNIFCNIIDFLHSKNVNSHSIVTFISVGRRLAPVACYIKEKLIGRYNYTYSNKSNDVKYINFKINILQILNPQLNYNLFDYVILPNHDYKHFHRGNNIIKFQGAITNLGQELKNYKPSILDNVLDRENKDIIAVMIGCFVKGNNQESSESERFLNLLEKYCVNINNIPVFITLSRRTDQETKQIIIERYNCVSTNYKNLYKGYINDSVMYVFDPKIVNLSKSNDDAYLPNPYLEMLYYAKYNIVTADSISMCAEVASTGKALYIYKNNFISKKHNMFVDDLIKSEVAKIFNEQLASLDSYMYDELNVAKLLANKLYSLIN